jgi:hypothetical protein
MRAYPSTSIRIVRNMGYTQWLENQWFIRLIIRPMQQKACKRVNGTNKPLTNFVIAFMRQLSSMVSRRYLSELAALV